MRPMSTLPFSSPSETGTSAGAGVAVVVVLAGMTKYRPIALRTVAFAAPPMPPLSRDPGGETVTRWLGIGDCFLYYTPQQGGRKKKGRGKKNQLEGQGRNGGNGGKGRWNGVGKSWEN